MTHGMVADKMPCGANSPDNLRTLPHEASNQKKGGADVMPGEHIEQLLRVRIIGTVIIRQGKFAHIRASDDRPAENLRRRPHGGVSISARSDGGRNSGSGKGGKHWV